MLTTRRAPVAADRAKHSDGYAPVVAEGVVIRPDCAWVNEDMLVHRHTANVLRRFADAARFAVPEQLTC